MQEQALPLFPPGTRLRPYQPIKRVKCPCCHQGLKRTDTLLAWRELRDWLVTNWEWVAPMLVLKQLHNPTALSLTEHPDLLWALNAEAGAEGLELNDMLAQILDSYFQNEFDLLHRRGRHRLEIADTPAPPKTISLWEWVSSKKTSVQSVNLAL